MGGCGPLPADGAAVRCVLTFVDGASPARRGRSTSAALYVPLESGDILSAASYLRVHVWRPTTHQGPHSCHRLAANNHTQAPTCPPLAAFPRPLSPNPTRC